jgi:hypothetical protein
MLLRPKLYEWAAKGFICSVSIHEPGRIKGSGFSIWQASSRLLNDANPARYGGNKSADTQNASPACGRVPASLPGRGRTPPIKIQNLIIGFLRMSTRLSGFQTVDGFIRE